MLAVQTEVQVTLPELFEKLGQRHYNLCSRDAQHLWLPTTLRLCQRCEIYGPIPYKKEELTGKCRLKDADLVIPFVTEALAEICRLVDAYLPAMVYDREGLQENCGLEDADLEAIPSFRFLRATLTIGNNSNTFQAPIEHILYDPYVVHQITDAEKRSAIWKSSRADDWFVAKWSNYEYKDKQNESVLLPDDIIPRECRRSMATVVAPWISTNGPEMGTLCESYPNIEISPFFEVNAADDSIRHS